MAKALARIRAEGWVCRLSLAPCTECGLPVAGPPRATVHPGCRRTRSGRYGRERRANPTAPSDRSTAYVARWRKLHPERDQQLRERDKARMRDAYHDLPGSAQAAILDRAHQADERDQPLTVEAAWASGNDWTEDEDRYVLDHLKTPARDVALHLGRTLWAVRNRRVTLRRRQERTGEDRP